MQTGDFTQERIEVATRIRGIRDTLDLTSDQYIGILGAVKSYAHDERCLPDGWEAHEDVLFESLGVAVKTTHDTNAWLGTKLYIDLIDGRDDAEERLGKVGRCVEENAALACPTRSFKIYMEARALLEPAEETPSFSVCERMLSGIVAERVNELTAQTSSTTVSPPGGH